MYHVQDQMCPLKINTFRGGIKTSGANLNPSGLLGGPNNESFPPSRHREPRHSYVQQDGTIGGEEPTPATKEQISKLSKRSLIQQYLNIADSSTTGGDNRKLPSILKRSITYDSKLKWDIMLEPLKR